MINFLSDMCLRQAHKFSNPGAPYRNCRVCGAQIYPNSHLSALLGILSKKKRVTLVHKNESSI